MKVRVVQRKITRLRRGDAILAVRWRDCGQREAGASQRSRVLGRFVMRHEVGDEVALVYRDAAGRVRGHESRYAPDCAVFVLVEVAP